MEKHKIDSSLADDSENATEATEIEGKIVGENTFDKILVLITPTSKEGYMWEFEDENRFKCTIEDSQFFNDYAAGKIALHGREIMRVKLKTIQRLLEGRKIKNEYFALKLEVVEDPAPKFL